MKIAHVSSYYLPRLGGIEMHVADLAARQAAAGHEVSVITSSPGAPRAESSNGPGGGNVEVLRVTEDMRHPSGRHLSAPYAGARAVLDGGFDVVHAHVGGWSPLAFAGAWAAPGRGIPTVVTCHSLLSWESPLYRGVDQVTGWRRRRVAWTAVSEVAASPLRRLLPAGTEVGVLPNGVDVADWQVRPEPRDTDEVLAVSVMRLAARKRPVQLLGMLRRAKARLPARVRLRTVIVGEGTERHQLERYLRRHGMDADVELRGRQTRAQIRALYRRADFFVAPARLESFGIAALEARCAGVPVVAMAASGIRDLISDGREGVLVDTDAQMTAAIVSLAASPDVRARMAAHNASVAPPFSWAEALARSEEAYQRAAAMFGVRLQAAPALSELSTTHPTPVVSNGSAAPGPPAAQGADVRVFTARSATAGLRTRGAGGPGRRAAKPTA